MNVTILTQIESIKQSIPRCIALAKKAGADLAFNYFHLPVLWWCHFNGLDSSAFWQKRGKNFLGTRSTLDQIFLLLVEKDGVLCAAAPFVLYRVRAAGEEQRDLRVLCYAGDSVLVPYQDVTVDPAMQKPALSALVESLVQLFQQEGADLLILGNQPDNSKNISVLRRLFAERQYGRFCVREAVSSIRGGVRPWTIRQLSRRVRKLSDRARNKGVEVDGLEEFSGKLLECSPLKLVFPVTRNLLDSELQVILKGCRAHETLAVDLNSVEQLLQDRAICYPNISLPAEHDEFLALLSRSTRYYYRRYMKSFKEAGGTFESVLGQSITDGDIEEYLHLHQMRWGTESMFVCGDTYDFHVEMVQAMAKEGCFALFFACFGGNRVAVLSCFDIYPRRECYFTGMNPEYRETRAGRLLWLHSIYNAIDNGFTRYDLGPGDFGYKMSFATGKTRSHNFLVYENDSPIDLDTVFSGYERMVAV